MPHAFTQVKAALPCRYDRGVSWKGIQPDFGRGAIAEDHQGHGVVSAQHPEHTCDAEAHVRVTHNRDRAASPMRLGTTPSRTGDDVNVCCGKYLGSLARVIEHRPIPCAVSDLLVEKRYELIDADLVRARNHDATALFVREVR